MKDQPRAGREAALHLWSLSMSSRITDRSTYHSGSYAAASKPANQAELLCDLNDIVLSLARLLECITYRLAREPHAR